MDTVKGLRFPGMLAVLWLLGIHSAYAVTLLSEDFEGTAAQIAARWPGQSYCCFPDSGGPFNLVSAPVMGGSQALRYNYVGTQADSPPQGGGSAEWDYAMSGQRDIWITWYSYMGAGFKTAGGVVSGANDLLSVATKGLYHYMKSASTGETHGWVFHYFYGGRVLTLSAQGIKDHMGPNGPGTGTAIPYDTENMWPNVQAYSQPDSQWVGYEAHFKLNTPGQADGVYELYVTPVSAGSPTFLSARHANREFVDSDNIGRMPGDSYWYRTKLYRQDGLGSLYIDNLSVTTTRIGVGGTPPPPPPVDTQAPSIPAGLSAQAASSSQINLTWNACTDNTSVTGYRIFRGGSQIATTAGTSYSNTGLTASTAYSYTVAAYDAAGNASAQSAAASATTPAATPPGPSGLLVDFGSSAGANTFGLAGWNTVIKDVYTTYQSAGPGGTMSGFNGAYDYQGVTGAARTFAAGDEIIVTWYNSGAAAATFSPQLSMTDPDRVDAGAVWHPMSSVTIPAAGTATTRFAFSAATAGSYALVNVNVNMDYGSLICDKIALVSAAAPADVLPPAKPRNMRVL